MPRLPILQQHDSEKTIAILLVTADRGLAGAFNSQILRAGLRTASEYESDGRDVTFYASGRRGVSSLTFRGREVAGIGRRVVGRLVLDLAQDDHQPNDLFLANGDSLHTDPGYVVRVKDDALGA